VHHIIEIIHPAYLNGPVFVEEGQVSPSTDDKIEYTAAIDLRALLFKLISHTHHAQVGFCYVDYLVSDYVVAHQLLLVLVYAVHPQMIHVARYINVIRSWAIHIIGA
jgi:hypothetical protein